MARRLQTSELTRGDLQRNRRRVEMAPGNALGATERETFDRHFREHPLGLRSVMAVPVFIDRRSVASFVVNRARRDFSERERQVLGWVAAGKTNWEIAQILAISPRTVQKHLEHVFDKFGVGNRLAAVVRAGAVPPAPSR